MPSPPKHRTPADLAYLESLLLSTTSSPGNVGRQRHGTLATIKKKKVPGQYRNASSTAVRQALFPSGPGSYPSENSPLRLAKGPRQPLESACNAANSVETGDEYDQKRREMGWNTSFPAEYVNPLGTQRSAAKQTLAYREHQIQKRHQNRAADDSGGSVGRLIEGLVGTDEQLLRLHKQVVVREGLLAKLQHIGDAAAHEREFDIAKGNELLHLLLELRDASVDVMQSLMEWHLSQQQRMRQSANPVGLLPFVFESANYCVKMVADLNFLSSVKALGDVLGVDPAKMKQNPFMMPEPLGQREFPELQTMSWIELPFVAHHLQQQQPGEQPNVVERVTEAEQYLVWCLVNVHSPQVHEESPEVQNPAPSSPVAPQTGNRAGGDHGSWQKRAEKQLELLSLPLESPSGRAYMMDSSNMMKRKGFLPSLPQSPAKTLTELVDTVHRVDTSQSAAVVTEHPLLTVGWGGRAFQCGSAELEALGTKPTPPHHMVTIVSASVLILLSPSDRLPKDLSWTSARKMLQGGTRLIDRMHQFAVASVPEFKWKALVPFLQNEQFQPSFLADVSGAAACLCAWVLVALHAAQTQSRGRVANGETSDVDRLELLGELEIDDVESRPPALPPLEDEPLVRPKSKSGKHVTIGNAEILFINENQPVGSTPVGSRPSSRRGETPPSPAPQAAGSSVLIRTSPWTFKGVTYFVSFFLEQDQSALSIKMYEPMSSVESQMYVSEDDLATDFGDAALDTFRRREYRAVCELILRQLDRMMGGGDSSRRASVPTAEVAGIPGGGAWSGLEEQASALDLLLDHADDRDTREDESLTEAAAEDDEMMLAALPEEEDTMNPTSDQAGISRQDMNEVAEIEVPVPNDDNGVEQLSDNVADSEAAEILRSDRDEGQFHPASEETETDQTLEDESVAASALEEEKLARQREEQRLEALLRIQCAARQKQARDKTTRVRYARQQAMDVEERRRRILTRIPTGVPGEMRPPSAALEEAVLEAYAEEGGDDDVDQRESAEETAAAVFVAEPAFERPDTSTSSYAGEAFDEFEEEEEDE